MAIEEKLVTAEELLALPDDGMRYELIRGVLCTMPPPGYVHEVTAARVLLRGGGFVEARDLGQVSGAAGILVERDPDLVRAPDFAFIAANRLAGMPTPSGYLAFPPDIVAEVMSPHDVAVDVEEKVQMWLRFGVGRVWVLYPSLEGLRVHSSATQSSWLGPDDMLDAGDLLPGFTCQVGDLFPDQ